ncbi:exonuclease SbcCD subunit D C-terminal domain-containing protein [Desulfobacter postgatei]|uniref:Nuclease SbcCD subunit D n=1 Tax=Desulfobacter postgatei 2ac9 TaxID=879212 RepID=I5B0E3_9BACT|nr:exonuclease SbcCD subunit D C-terminal domain-containing protein [Desulfobacter postgatei]EIM62956.1 exonuclease SbcD [Desulfobacter postgatei 2ac9]
MKILHTSDWHLGRSLYGRKRYEEFSAFLDWLAQTIEDEKVDALLVAGDLFDTSTPSNRAQELYYRFLCRVAASCCRHVVVIAGNHDSPSFLNAPKELLRALNVYVVGSMTDVLEDEVIPILDFGLRNADCEGNAINLEKSAIICAIPYLRDKDVRTVEPGETIDDKNRKLVEGIKAHYAEVVKIAERKREEIIRQSAIKNPQSQIPIVAMGHLFTAGGKTVDGDGVRELYVGSLAHVGAEVFPSAIDYLALGHLHVPQAVGSAEHIRYCGSPIPMGYGEATQKKKVVLIEFNSTTPKIQELPVPCFQELVRIVGSLDDIHTKLEALKKRESAAWLEIEYTGSDIIGNLRKMLDEAMADSAMEIRRIKNRRGMDRVISTVAEDETLDDLDAGDVFTRCLDAFEVPDEDREELTVSYNEIIKSLHEEDVNEF